MYDVITFGSASEDIYLKSKKFFPVWGKYFTTGRGLCFNSGAKIELEEAFFFTGGGGTNAAATFSSQGLKTSFCGAVGSDHSGKTVMEELKRLSVDISLVKVVKNKKTNTSIILSYPGQDKTVLVYRGASDTLKKSDIPWGKIRKTKWFYLAPFSGELAKLTEDLVLFANNNKIKVALNPGYNLLNQPVRLKKILKETDVLILNQEEASQVTGIPFRKEKGIFKKLDFLTKGICVMTRGDKGAVISDGKYLYSSKGFKIKIVDTTGAGDSFGSAFVAGIIKKNNIAFGMQLGIANAVSNIKEFGAKVGILRAGQAFKKAKVKIEPCGENSICKRK